MSICPKNKSSKGRRDKRRANWKMCAPNLGKMQQMWCSYDAAQSLQSLWFLQQKRESLQWTNIHKSESVPMCNAAKGSRHRGLFCCLCGLSGSVI